MGKGKSSIVPPFKGCKLALAAALALPASVVASESFLFDTDYQMSIGNFTTIGKAKSDEQLIFGRVKDTTVGYSSTYIDVTAQTVIATGFQVGLGIHAHAKTGNKSDSYREKFPESSDVYFSDTYLKYSVTDATFAQLGTFNVRNIAGRFDPQYGRGAYAQYSNDDNFAVTLGAIDKFAFFFNDFVRDFEDVDVVDRYQVGDPSASEAIGNTIYFAEFYYQVNDNLELSPFVYHQNDYVGWYGLDTLIDFKQQNSEYGVQIFVYYLDSKLHSDSVEDLDKNSTNFSINPYYYLDSWRFNLGFTKFGDNPVFNNPTWGYRYFTNVLNIDHSRGYSGSLEVVDYNSVYGQKGTEVLFGRTGYVANNWELNFNAAYYDPEQDEVVDSLWEVQLGGNLTLSEKLALGARVVSIFADEKPDQIKPGGDYIETWVSYQF